MTRRSQLSSGNITSQRHNFYLGQALQRLGEWQHAAQAYQVAVLQAPGMRRAHLALARIYERRLGQPERAAEHRRFADENIKDE